MIFMITARSVDTSVTGAALSTVYAAGVSATIVTSTTTVSTITSNGCC